MRQLNFPFVTIFRPGLLGRTGARFIERIAGIPSNQLYPEALCMSLQSCIHSHHVTTHIMLPLTSCYHSHSHHVTTPTHIMLPLMSCYHSHHVITYLHHVTTYIMLTLTLCYHLRHVNTYIMLPLTSCYHSHHVTTQVSSQRLYQLVLWGKPWCRTLTQDIASSRKVSPS